jgi:D-cysteine desulfhydrase family pyridoxal phosphate-dependent enzyme
VAEIDLHRYPRVALAHLPTPLEPCRRLQRERGGALVWLKRDDCTGLAVGGNKTRKLEFLLGRAIAEGAPAVVTTGALQSNHARQTAAACARLGLACHLVLRRTVPRYDEHYTRSGNVLLGELFGAEITVVATPEEAADAMAAVVERTGAYAVPLGGSDPVGVLGYVDAGLELAEQLGAAGIEAAAVVCAASSCGTAAGLTIAMAAVAGPPVVAVAVSDDGPVITAMADGLIAETCESLGIDPPPGPVVVDRHIGPAYGIPTDESLAAIDLLARTEGVLLDPVYTAKAFAHVLAGTHDAGAGDVVFVHTGGTPGLFAYTPAFAASNRATVRSAS